MIHLDTSFLIRALVPGTTEEGRLRGWLGTRRPLAMSTVAWAEFLCGPIAEPHTELATRIVSRRIAFGQPEAKLTAELFNVAGRRRGSLVDCMIAATALRAGSRLATANPRDFGRFVDRGLELVEINSS